MGRPDMGHSTVLLWQMKDRRVTTHDFPECTYSLTIVTDGQRPVHTLGFRVDLPSNAKHRRRNQSLGKANGVINKSVNVYLTAYGD